MKWNTIVRVGGLGLVPLLVAACASFPADRLPKVDAIPSQGQVSNKPSVYLALRFLRDLSGGETPGPGSEVTPPRPGPPRRRTITSSPQSYSTATDSS
jgi:hypothetical protein